MDADLILRWLHVTGACVLLGTGAGIAFFMLMAHRTCDTRLIAHTAGVVVLADLLFTATAVIAQPITGGFLAWRLGWPFSEGWLALSLGLYVLTGAFWLPVVWIQLKLRDLARAAAAAGEELPARYPLVCDLVCLRHSCLCGSAGNSVADAGAAGSGRLACALTVPRPAEWAFPPAAALAKMRHICRFTLRRDHPIRPYMSLFAAIIIRIISPAL